MLVFVADMQRWMDLFAASDVRSLAVFEHRDAPGLGDLMMASSDALIAAQTAVVAAESLGIGSCYIGDVLEQAEIHAELLGLPNHTLPVAMVCLRPAAQTAAAHAALRVARHTHRPLPPADCRRGRGPLGGARRDVRAARADARLRELPAVDLPAQVRVRLHGRDEPLGRVVAAPLGDAGALALRRVARGRSVELRLPRSRTARSSTFIAPGC